MIIGIGADLCEISRMAALLSDTVFLKRYFNDAEQVYILSRGVFAAASMAGSFAAKEAFAKALGSGFEGVKPEEIVILHRANSAPYFDLRGGALAASDARGVKAKHLSITHEAGIAMAVAVLEGD
jgi:holo-[acyl-carrier protein] synthase